ncbi:MAG: hypothetical protein WDN49_09650 [Acetobacteraceae bacterium]
MTRAPSSHAAKHQFGQKRPPAEGGHTQAAPLYHGSKVQPLPAPTGAAPYRLNWPTSSRTPSPP